MAILRRNCAAIAWICVALFGAQILPRQALAQLTSKGYELSTFGHVDEVNNRVRSQFDVIDRQLADHQWDEAVEGLRRLIETSGNELIAVAGRRYTTVANYCHLRIAALPKDALELYRSRVDPMAQKLLDEGQTRRDAGRLENVTRQYFASSAGDKALWTLGEMALEEGRYAAARAYWEKLIPRAPQMIPAKAFDGLEATPDELKLIEHWYPEVVEKETGAPRRLRRDEYLDDATAAALIAFWKERGIASTHLAFPATDLDLARVRAALVLVSIRELALDRARAELEALEHLHPAAKGEIEGRAAPYADELKAQIAAAEKWPAARHKHGWRTFAGAIDRNGEAPRAIDLGSPAWASIPLEPASNDSSAASFGSRPAPDTGRDLLSYHPLVAGDLLLYCTQTHVFAFNVRTGKPAWPREDHLLGEIFEFPSSLGLRLGRGVGPPRFTMTEFDGKLYARMGSQVTSRPADAPDPPSAIVCLDLRAEGMLLWRLTPDEPRWAFEGAPIIVGHELFVGMRKSDVRPQAAVACYDLSAAPPRLRWRTIVASADTVGGGQQDEVSHNLLTYQDETLYYNTNLGAVAALAAQGGQVQWAVLYPRVRRSTLAPQRDLTPCVYDHGVLFVAPGDSDAILALDASTGETVWESRLAEDAVHLLGVGNGNLLASGDKLWWFDVETGRAARTEGLPLGYGRGLLAGDKVLWPTRRQLYVFDQRLDGRRAPHLAHDPIPLGEGRGARGGNLVPAGDKLLIADADRLYAIREAAGGAAPVASRRAKTAPASSPKESYAPRR